MKSFEQVLYDMEKYDLKTTVTDVDRFRVLYDYANGCGAKGGVKFPKTMWGVNIESACILHDIEWVMAQNYFDLKKGNELFDDNLKKICDKESNTLTIWLRRMRIAKYVSAVELVGLHNEAIKRGFT